MRMKEHTLSVDCAGRSGIFLPDHGETISTTVSNCSRVVVV